MLTPYMTWQMKHGHIDMYIAHKKVAGRSDEKV
jgi:hypothetical protein